MICYRDMTFCPFWRSCADGKDCSRALTDEVAAKAEEVGLGVCQWNGQPGCYKPTENQTDTTGEGAWAND